VGTQINAVKQKLFSSHVCVDFFYKR